MALCSSPVNESKLISSSACSTSKGRRATSTTPTRERAERQRLQFKHVYIEISFVISRSMHSLYIDSPLSLTRPLRLLSRFLRSLSPSISYLFAFPLHLRRNVLFRFAKAGFSVRFAVESPCVFSVSSQKDAPSLL